MHRDLVELVWQRAGRRCEYCLFPAEWAYQPMQIDHILAEKHGGETVAENLALACFDCNSYKGPNIASVDPLTGKLTPLYHPRRHRWLDHFAWDDAILIGQSAIGRVTILVLRMNHPDAVHVRQLLSEIGETLEPSPE
jgi:hypothetical protein